ncbi:MAG: CoA transferase [Alphaproteobacteria bacterium]
MSDNSSALSDIKILDFSHLLAGPFATQTLGDYGAEVYKIERIHVGDDFRRWNFLIKKLVVTHLQVTWLGTGIKDQLHLI